MIGITDSGEVERSSERSDDWSASHLHRSRTGRSGRARGVVGREPTTRMRVEGVGGVLCRPRTCGKRVSTTMQWLRSVSHAFSIGPARSTRRSDPTGRTHVSPARWTMLMSSSAFGLSARPCVRRMERPLSSMRWASWSRRSQNGVGLVGVAIDGVPVRDGQLAGDEGRGAFGAVLDDLGEVAPLGVAKRREHPVVESPAGRASPGESGAGCRSRRRDRRPAHAAVRGMRTSVR